MTGVLEGIRVVDLCRAGPGRASTWLLADYGADAISIIDPALVPRRVEGQLTSASARIFRVNHRNKRSMLLNLQTHEGRQILYRLIETADGFLESNRPGVVERLEVDYATLKKINPRLVYCSLSGYGQYGPYSGWAAHDISYQAVGGMLVKDDNGRFMIPPYNQADINAAWNGAMALLMGLLHSQRTGKGEYIDVAFSDGAIPIWVGGIQEGPLTGAYPCYNIYETKDGKYVTLSVLEPWFWQRLCRMLGREEWLPHQMPKGALKDEMFDFFRQTFKSKTLAEWLKILEEADVEFGPVNETMDDVANDPHNKARESIIEVKDPLTGRNTKQTGFIFKFTNNPATVRFGPSLFGTETRDILRELAYDKASINRLEEEGVVALP